MTIRKTYYPSKTFDDELDALARLFQSKGWQFADGVIEQLALDALAQREERAAHDTVRSQYVAAHEAFGLAQLERHKRFMALLNAARGMFREDKVVMAELDRFGRQVGRPRKTAEEEGAA
jgi:hypothetical protein